MQIGISLKVFTECFTSLSEFSEMQSNLSKRQPISISGCVDSQKLHMIYGLGDGISCKIIATFSALRAKEIYEEYKMFDPEVVHFPAKDLIFFQADIHSNQLTKERIKAFRKILEGQPVTIVTTFSAFMAPCLPLESLLENRIFIAKDSLVEERALASKLVKMGYEKVDQVEGGGQFSIRGGIIDVFDLTEENPYRIELWGDSVDSLRSFDVLSQRSIESLEQIAIYPATEMMMSASEKEAGVAAIAKDADQLYEHFRAEFKTEEAARIKKQVETLKEQILEFGVMANLDSYIRYFYKEVICPLDIFASRDTLLFLDEPNHIREHAQAVELEFRESMMHRLEKGYALPKQADLLYSSAMAYAKAMTMKIACLSTLETKVKIVKVDHYYHIATKSINSYNGSFDALVKDLNRYKKNGFGVLVLSGSRSRAKRLAADLFENDLNCFYSEDNDRIIQNGEVMVKYGQLRKGFEYPMLKFAIISETDIFGNTQKQKKKRKRYEGQKINDFSELKVGDYVVHENHGLGVYRGIEKIEAQKVVKDYMKIEYRDGGNLYVLATGFHAIQKYASADAKKPKLNKLGSQEWNKTKTKVKGAIGEVAKELVELYAIRQQKEGFTYGKDTVWQREFEELFPYQETDDQMQAIDDTKADMESRKIMDRLICGDVGYGKTEVAIRAAFKAVQEGKQVAYLVPTTILAQQHYETFVQRMKDFPVKVGMLSRFRTPADQKKTIEGLKKGMVDIVIGTHRLLSKDIVFKDLGLLIVDEEQRFGVTHKEKIKQLKDDVDVLTLTATPIPRTLHMSLVGIRDMSVLEEPPNDRVPIQTYVLEYNEEMVREAIVRELSRQGQVYYVYNRVNNIADIAGQLQKLVPEATVEFAHGQMKEHELERIMYDFINGDIDVLVSTTIIETGLDIANVNTMIIHDSDNMGLSQLYQLRGRVGRSNRNSYAFLMYKRDKVLKEVAEKRLQVIKEFTELGSGFKIAMRDLEIRGAGNLLGAKQHGHMEAVGYDLYCKMLNEAVKTLKGITAIEDFNTMIDLDVDAFIPPAYIMNEYQKLDIYKRIASIDNLEECVEMKEELMDRFGNVPISVENLLRISLIRVDAHKLFVTDLKGKKDGITIKMLPTAQIRVENIEVLLNRFSNKLKFITKGVPTFHLKLQPIGLVEKDEEMILEMTEKIVGSMKELLL